MFDSLQLHGLQHTRLPCHLPSPRVCLNSCPRRKWCHPTILSSVAAFSWCLQSFPASGFFPMSCLCIRRTKYWSFSFNISPSNEYSELISFRVDWFDPLTVQGTLKSLLQHHSLNINSLVRILLSGPTLTSMHDYWKNHSIDYMDLCQQSDVLLHFGCLGLSQLFFQGISIF